MEVYLPQKVSELAFPNLQHSNHSRRTAIHVTCGLVADNQLVWRLNPLTSDDRHNSPPHRMISCGSDRPQRLSGGPEVTIMLAFLAGIPPHHAPPSLQTYKRRSSALLTPQRLLLYSTPSLTIAMYIRLFCSYRYVISVLLLSLLSALKILARL